jgi:biotin carboxylase
MIKIAVIGASYLQLPLVKKINALGYESHCFAWESEDSVCKDVAHYFYPISIIDKESIYNKCTKIKIDAILSIASDVAVPTISYVANKMGLVANSDESALISTNKLLMRSGFKRVGLPTPFYFSVSESTYFDDKLKLSFPLIVKPTDRSGSRGVSLSNSLEELMKNIEKAVFQSFKKEAIIEEYIEGKEYSIESISQNGEHTVLAITEKITSGSPYFVELEHHQPAALTKDLKNQIEATVKKGLDALEIRNGAAHSEIKINEKGIYLIEIGGRMGGDFIGSHLVQLSTGYDYLKNIINVALGIKIEGFQPKVAHFSGVYFLSKLTQDLLPYFLSPPTNKNYFLEVKLQSTDFEDVYDSSNRTGYLIYQGDSKLTLL